MDKTILVVSILVGVLILLVVANALWGKKLVIKGATATL